jgi:hypothetical protein
VKERNPEEERNLSQRVGTADIEKEVEGGIGWGSRG